MSETTQFNTNELLQMYFAVHNLISENNTDLDTLPLVHPERESYISQNRTLNSCLRKLKTILASAGIDPGKMIRKAD